MVISGMCPQSAAQQLHIRANQTEVIPDSGVRDSFFFALNLSPGRNTPNLEATVIRQWSDFSIKMQQRRFPAHCVTDDFLPMVMHLCSG